MTAKLPIPMAQMNPLRTALAQFIGSTQWFRHSFNRAVIYTEGIQYLTENSKAYWLIDTIASHLASDEFRKAAKKDDRISLMHFWKLAVKPDKSATLKGVADSGEQPFIQQEIPLTAFPLDEVDIWAQNEGQNWTLLCPANIDVTIL
ncbi:DUF6876 family protein [Planctomicrobium sp. SH664]|uniref:DUF6876 family protein n=1 Tax=Planctomicrobium sp. SH664 TaxID=3448125 RepID=UPI003F5B3F7C